MAITVEELEIIVRAKVQEAMKDIRKIVPQIKQVATDTQKIIKQNSTSISNISQGIKKAFDPNNVSFKMFVYGKKQIEGVTTATKKLTGNVNQLSMAYERARSSQDKLSETTATPRIEKMGKYKMATPLPDLNKGLIQDNSKEKQASRLQVLYGNLIAKVKQFNFESAKNRIPNIGKSLKNAQSQMSKLTAKLKVGLGQILKFAGALVGIRSVYNGIKNLASQFLSSGTEQANRLSANIEYMKYALSSILAPVIEYLVNLGYKLLKIIQNLVYAMTGINIFAKASAKSYANMASSAKKASNATANFDEISNIQKDTDTQTNSPSMDLSEVSNPTGIFKDILNADWGSIGEKISAGIIKALDSITKKIKSVDWGSIGKNISEAITSIDWAGIGNGILNTLWSVLSGIVILFLNIDWGKVASTLSTAVKSWIQTITKLFKETDWGELGKNLISKIIDFVMNVDWLGIMTSLFNLLIEIILSLGELIIGAVVEIAKKAWEGIKSVFSKVAEFFGDIFSKAWEKVKEVFSTGGKIFDGIKDGIVNAFKTIVNAIIRGINKVVALPFNAINSVLRSIKNIDILGVKPFTWINTISVPQIPELAKGGAVYQDTIAMIGEYSTARTNPEIVSPQSIMRETFLSALSEYASNNRNEQISLEIPLKVDGKTIAKATIDDLNNLLKIKGYKPIYQM